MIIYIYTLDGAYFVMEDGRERGNGGGGGGGWK
jgi:hypothetical protein